MNETQLFSAPFLAEQQRRWGGDAAYWLAQPPQVLPLADDPAWQAPLAVLRQTRNREWLRLAVQALHGAPLAETLAQLSGFADAAIQAALTQAQRLLAPRFGEPRSEGGALAQPIVLGMGKLGGGELNFSSDIDLIGLYSHTGETSGPRCISNGEYFVKLMQEVVRLLGTLTEDGFVFRVDLMLRPFGSASPVAISVDAAEDYYQTHGREWERYALIKARPVAGDLLAGEAFLRTIKPFIYRRYLDFNALAALRDLKRRIAADAVARGVATSDLKVGEGGIRECEFIVQSFQLIRGGQDARLVQRSWAATLQALQARQLLGPDDASALHAAYQLLRRTENAVQMWADMQTHALPTEAATLAWLAAGLGYPSTEAWQAALHAQRQFVSQLFANVLQTHEQAPPAQHPQAQPLAQALEQREQRPHNSAVLESLAALFGSEAPLAAQALASLKSAPLGQGISEATEARLAALLPLLASDACALASSIAPAQAFARALQVVTAVVGRSTYLALLHESAQARSNLLLLVGKSQWITQELARHPILLDQLLDARSLYSPPSRDSFRQELIPRIAALDSDDVEAAMNTLRQLCREAQLRIAAADVVAGLPLVKVSDALSWLAEAALDAALDFTWRAMASAHGVPQQANGQPATFAVVGYGKLAALEMGYGSDLDLVFVHNASPPDADTVGGKRPLPQQLWMGRLVQKLINLLTTQTHLGRAYEVDLALRPNGASGLPVVALSALAEYQQQRAWTWEHQALSRARAVAGDRKLGSAFNALRLQVLQQPRDAASLTAEIATMRQKMREHLSRPRSGQWNLKQGPGGLIDVEFLVAHSVLLHAHAHPEVAVWPDVWRQLEALTAAAALAPATADVLLSAQRSYRAALHLRSLQGQGAEVGDGEFLADRLAITTLWKATFG